MVFKLWNVINGRVDASFFRRLIDILFPTQFVNHESEILNETYKLKDESFKKDDFKENHKFALIKILMESKNKIYIPKIVKDRSEQYLLSNDEIYTFITENYEMTDCETDFVKVPELFNFYKTTPYYTLLSYEERRELNSRKFKDIISSNPKFSFHHRKNIKNKYYKSIVTNLKIKNQNSENEFETDEE